MKSDVKGRDIKPAEGKLGVLLPGMGAVATTFVAGVEAIRRGLSRPIGSLTQMGTIRLGKRTDNRSPRVADFVRSFSELSEGDGCRKLADLDGEVSELHLAGEDFVQRARASFRTAHRDAIARNEQWYEEGETLDVIPVRVTQQDRHRQWPAGSRHQRTAQCSRASPTVQDEAGSSVRRHFHA